MSSVLSIAQEHITDITSGGCGISGHCSEKHWADTYSQCPVHIVVETPSYVSFSCTVELKTRHERSVLAKTRFTELAGDNGVGSWVIMPEGRRWRLYVLALDPGSVEVQSLRVLVEAGVSVSSVSSAYLDSDYRQTARDSMTFKAVVEGSSVHVALLNQGCWVFARRIEFATGSPLDTIRSTLHYLKSQNYIGFPFQGTWELTCADDVRRDLSELWKSIDPLLSEPLDSAPLSNIDRERSLSHFNNVPLLNAYKSESGGQLVVKVLGLLSALIAAYLLPQLVLARIDPPQVHLQQDQDNSGAVDTQYWMWRALELHTPADPIDTLQGVNAILTVLQSFREVSVQELAIESSVIYRFRCSFGSQWSDPSQKRAIYESIRQGVLQELPNYRVSFHELNALSLSERQSEISFELLTEPSNDSE